MALEIFLRLDGVIGGARNYYHPGSADVMSWQWCLSGTDSASPADELHIVKRVGIESPTLMRLWAEREVVPAGEISIVPVVGKRDAQQKFICIKLENIRVLSMEVGGSVDDNHATEKLTLRFELLRFEFHHYIDATPDSPDGTAQSVAFDWRAPAA